LPPQPASEKLSNNKQVSTPRRSTIVSSILFRMILKRCGSRRCAQPRGTAQVSALHSTQRCRGSFLSYSV
jgi:hypothetical protein